MSLYHLLQIPQRIGSAWSANRAPLEHQIRAEFPSQVVIQTSRRLCLFAHFDSEGEVDPYVVKYLEELKTLGCDIVFLTSSPCFTENQGQKVSTHCVKIIHRTNVGLDFGAWRLGLKILGPKIFNYDQLILANDSVYGPIQDLAPIFSEMSTRHLDLWGMTDCREISPHLQSYFLVFEKSILNSRFFLDFWSNTKVQWRKRSIILKYEIGLSLEAQRANFKIGSFVTAEKLGIGKLNPTLFAWDRLISEFKFPFLKTEILKLNRFNSLTVKSWHKMISTVSQYNPDLILNHLKRVAPAKASELAAETQT